jgi:hypothetical protein
MTNDNSITTQACKCANCTCQDCRCGERKGCAPSCSCRAK